MITENEAVKLAWELIHRRQVKVRRFRSVEVAPAPTFLPAWAERGNVWEVTFDLDVPPAFSPDMTSVIVDRVTGEVASIELL